MPRAPYACDPASSRGRLYAEPESKSRSAFRRDCDRIIHSTAFRRLKHKTQVFVFDEGDHYRTRLTHTLEVAQIARALARALGLDEDLAEALALAHDLGHPPFGHAGERALDECLAAFGGFDHNAQTLRVVTALERRYPDFDGLNLTWETLEGLVKHNGPLTDRDGTPLGRYRERRRARDDPRLFAAAGSGPVELSRRWRRKSPRSPTTSPTTPTTSTMACAPDCSRSTTSPPCALPGRDHRRDPRGLSGARRRPAGARIHPPADRPADRGRGRRDRAPARRARAALGRRRAARGVAGRGLLAVESAEADRAIKAFSKRAHVPPPAGHARHGRRPQAWCATCLRATARIPATCRRNGSEGLADADDGARARRIADFIAGMTDRYALAEHAPAL